MNAFKRFPAEIGRMLGSRLVRILLIWVPLGIGLLFGFTFNWKRIPTEIPIAVWNRDDQSLSRDFLRHIDSLQSIRIIRRITDGEQGKELLCSGKVRGFIEIPKDFSKRLRTGRSVQVIFYQDFNFLLPGRTLTKAISKLELWQQELHLKEFFTRHGLSGSMLTFLENPLKVEYRKLYNPSLDYTRFLLPGLLTSLLFQSLLLLGGKLFLSWQQGDLWRLIFAALLSSLIPFTICYIILFPLFSLDAGNLLQLLPIYILFSLATLLMGMLMAALLRQEVLTIEIIVALGAVGFTLTGFTWPREMYPAALRHLVGLYPLTWMYEESLKIWYRTGYTVNPLPLLGLIVLFAVPLSLLVHNRRNKLAQEN